MTSPAPVWQHPTDAGAHDQAARPVTVDPFQHSGQLPDIVSQAPRAARGFRARLYATAPAGPPTDTGPAGKQLATGEHAHPGSPDPRALFGSQVQAGNPGHTRDDLATSPEQIVNQQAGPNVVDPQNAPVRPRAGFTSEDNTRLAVAARWLFGRPFDQWAERHPGSIDKAPSAAPRAATPPTYGEDVAGGIPSPGGRWRARGMEAAGIQPNSVRLLPRAWDAQLVNDGSGQPDASVQAAASARARGWRA